MVLEVDGKGHYSGASGDVDPTEYAETMSADRELRLWGYEVFRFGAEELRHPARAEPILRDFFYALFDRYAVVPT